MSNHNKTKNRKSAARPSAVSAPPSAVSAPASQLRPKDVALSRPVFFAVLLIAVILAVFGPEKNLIARICFAFLFVIWFSYWLPPTFDATLHTRPPGVVRIAYSLVTVLSCLYGWLAVHDSEALANDIRPVLNETLLPQKVNDMLPIMVTATTVVLTFVLGNLMRSYANLHVIEHENDTSALAACVRGLGPFVRWVEWSIRVLMFISILAVDQLFVALEADEPIRMMMFFAASFRRVFGFLWVAMSAYYILLIAWDLIVLNNLEHLSRLFRVAVRRKMWREAMPVHAIGLAAAVLMGLTFWPSEFSQHPSGEQIMIFVWSAMLLAAVGILILAWSARPSASTRPSAKTV